MLLKLARTFIPNGPAYLFKQSIRTTHQIRPSSKVGSRLARSMEKDTQEQAECLFPVFNNLDVITEDRVHKFNAPCDRVIKFIKLGAINKMIATQYCHYLAYLTRISTDQGDVEYYGRRCFDIYQHLFLSEKDMPQQMKAKLYCDIANTTRENCIKVCQKVVHELENIRNDDMVGLLSACYRFSLFKQAQALVTNDKKMSGIYLRLIEPFVTGIILAGDEYQKADDRGKVALRSDVLGHIHEILSRCYNKRQQFVTKHKQEFIDALRRLDISVTINPQIKMTGRCTNCNNHLPLFDAANVPKINQATLELLNLGSDKDLYLNSCPSDLAKFERFLKEIYEKDKRPIDIVIDGLNVAYRHSIGVHYVKRQLSEDLQLSKRVRSVEGQTQVLINTIIRSDLVNKFRKILIVGKHHMTRWPGLMDFFRANKIHFYPSLNHSKDDLFQIYASTLSPKTMLMTGDFFRDHLSSLSEENCTLLERWLDTRQVWVDNRSLRSIWPTPYEKIPSVDESKDIFHIPLIDFNLLVESDEHEPPAHLNNRMLTWICCDSRSNR